MILYDDFAYYSTYFMGRIGKVNVYESVVLMSAACPPFNPCIQHPTLSLFKTFQASNGVWTMISEQTCYFSALKESAAQNLWVQL